MKKIYSVCHIGAGRIGFTLEFDKRRAKPATHIGMWKKNKNVKLSAVCEKNETQHFYINGTDVTNEIRSNEVSKNVSKISSLNFVRNKMVETQRKYAKKQLRKPELVL